MSRPERKKLLAQGGREHTLPPTRRAPHADDEFDEPGDLVIASNPPSPRGGDPPVDVFRGHDMVTPLSLSARRTWCSS